MESLRIVAPGAKIRVVLLGADAKGVNLLGGLLKSPHVTVVGIMPVSNIKRFSGLKQHPAEKELIQLARENQIKILNTTSVNTSGFRKAMEQLKPDVVLIGGWPEILKPNLLSTKNFQVINCHGSMLPKYRGACPYMAAVFYGERQTGFTFHLVDEGIDTGDILFQEAVDIEEGETALELFKRISVSVGDAIAPLFEKLAAGTVVPRQQQGLASYVPMQRIEWGWIPWEMPPGIIGQRLRAFRGFLPLITLHNNVVVAFENGELKAAENKHPTSPGHQSHDFLRKPGVVMDDLPSKIVVSTLDPGVNLELYKPMLVSTGRSAKVTQGDQFFSLECHGILKSA